MERCDVVVVGAGPTGLLLAAELVLGGARVVVLERRTEIDPTEKAGGIGPLAAEALQRRGLGAALDAAEDRSLDEVFAMQDALGTKTARARMKRLAGNFAKLDIDLARQREPDRRFRVIRQQELETILNDHARAVGVDIRRGTSLASFRETEDAVIVNETISASWLVGCDGGRSGVRKLAGFAFEGTAPTVVGRQAVVELDHPERLLPIGWRRTPRGLMAYGLGANRVMTVEFRAGGEHRDTELTREELETSIRTISGIDVRVLRMERPNRWTDHARLADRYRKGRIFLAGDAAHVHSPFGGQGLSLGLVDAANLGWKLAAVVRGDLPADLLETYSAERRPVAAAVLENTRAQIALLRPDDHTSALRSIFARLLATDEGMRIVGEMMTGLAARYDLGSTDPLVGTSSPHLSDVVVATTAEEEAVARRHRVGVLRGDEPRYARPDGCIAWAGGPGLAAALARWAPAA